MNCDFRLGKLCRGFLIPTEQIFDLHFASIFAQSNTFTNYGISCAIFLPPPSSLYHKSPLCTFFSSSQISSRNTVFILKILIIHSSIKLITRIITAFFFAQVYSQVHSARDTHSHYCLIRMRSWLIGGTTQTIRWLLRSFKLKQCISNYQIIFVNQLSCSFFPPPNIIKLAPILTFLSRFN